MFNGYPKVCWGTPHMGADDRMGVAWHTVRELYSRAEQLRVDGQGCETAEADSLLELLHKGNLNRTQHTTDENSKSSRSHAIFQVYVTHTKYASGTSDLDASAAYQNELNRQQRR